MSIELTVTQQDAIRFKQTMNAKADPYNNGKNITITGSTINVNDNVNDLITVKSNELILSGGTVGKYLKVLSGGTVGYADVTLTAESVGALPLSGGTLTGPVLFTNQVSYDTDHTLYIGGDFEIDIVSQGNIAFGGGTFS